MVGLYLALGLLGAWYLLETTSPGADVATYQRAADALWTTGDPYASAADVPEDYRYRYPPLLAMVFPVLGWPPLWFALRLLRRWCRSMSATESLDRPGYCRRRCSSGPGVSSCSTGMRRRSSWRCWRSCPSPAPRCHRSRVRHHAQAPSGTRNRLVCRPARMAVARLVFGAMAVLMLVQLPWLGAMVRFYLSDPMATETIPGMSLRALGVVPWILGDRRGRRRGAVVRAHPLRLAPRHRPAARRAAAAPPRQPGSAPGGTASSPGGSGCDRRIHASPVSQTGMRGKISANDGSGASQRGRVRSTGSAATSVPAR